ncbi:MAG: methyltransferase, partial [Clostridia bacterium]|nr:methyltransferase [Clostridia bacterium]
MKRNMQKWLEDIRLSPTKKALPILSFPAISLMDTDVSRLIADSDSQARGMKLVADRTDSAAAVSLMDLSVEAECFGSEVRVSKDEVPTVIGSIVRDMDAAEALKVPEVGTARSGLYIKSIEKALELITDRPVFAGVIGPFSLAARLLDVTEIMMDCYDDPDMVHTVLAKVTEFTINYCKAYKEVGANGIVIAEPVAGILSPSLNAEFSVPYVKNIVDAVQDENFIVIYHNCGNNVLLMAEDILSTG